MSIEDDRALVRDQCLVIAHMATALAKVHTDLARIYTGGGPADQILDMAGRRMARLMECLGDEMNNMDIVENRDEWCAPIFEAAQKRWSSAESEDAGT